MLPSSAQWSINHQPCATAARKAGLRECCWSHHRGTIETVLPTLQVRQGYEVSAGILSLVRGTLACNICPTSPWILAGQGRPPSHSLGTTNHMHTWRARQAEESRATSGMCCPQQAAVALPRHDALVQRVCQR